MRTGPRPAGRCLAIAFAVAFGLLATSSAAAPVSPIRPGSVDLAQVVVEPTLAHVGAVSPLGEVCSTTALCPATVQKAYNVTPLLTNASRNGTGQAVVIVDACGDPKIASDLATFDAVNSLPTANLTVYYPQGTPCGNAQWSIETSLDVEWAHVMAPGAALHLVVSARATNADLFGAWNYSLTRGLGSQFSDSWSGPGGCPVTGLKVIQRAGALGVTVLASSGDGGNWGLGTGQPGQYPADCAPVLTIGGTTLSVNSTGAYVGERAWSGSGGGFAPGTKEKAYQKAVHVPDSYGTVAKPDVAAVADPSTGVWVYNEKDGGWSKVGGTSVSCPLWAGFVADANSWRASLGYGPAGTLDQFLYEHVYGNNGTATHYRADFHDVASGSNGWPAVKGWDAATGLGSFDAFTLARTLGTSAGA